MTGAGLRRLRLTESSAAVKFAPQYVAEDRGLFADIGLEVVADVPAGPAGSWLAENLASGRADVALGGVWLPLLYSQIGRQHLVPVAVMCHRNPAVLLGREPASGPWSWDALHGKRLLLRLAATSQWMFLRGVLHEHGVDLSRVRIVRDLHGETTDELWRSGFADYYLVEPMAAAGLLGEASHVATTLADAAGPVPWSVYYTTADLAAAEPALWQRFRGALTAATSWLLDSDLDDVVTALHGRFPGRPEHLRATLRHLRSSGVWESNAAFDVGSLVRYQHMMVDYGLLDHVVEPGPLWPLQHC